MPDFGHFDALRRFREALVLDSGRTYAQAQAPFQVARFEAWDVGRRVYCESCTGSSKTTDVAAWILSWVALHRGWEAVIYAVDKDQAARILTACSGFLLRTPGLRQPPFGLEVQRNRVLSALTSSSCSVDSSDEASAEGLLVDCVVCEQLESWKKPDVWTAIITRAHKRDCKVIIIANACRRRDDWHHKIRAEASTNAREWRFISVNADELPWMTPANLDEARRLALSDAAFRRLYYNEIGTTDQALWPEETLQIMLCLSGPAKERTADMRRVVLGLDLGVYSDPTALCVLGEDITGKQRLLNLQVWQGSRERPVQIHEVGEAVVRWMQQYKAEVLVYDPWQMIQEAQELRLLGVPTREYRFTPASVDWLVGQLYRRGVDGMMELYPHAGRSVRDGREWDLTEEARSCAMKETPLGFKLEQSSGGTKDRLIALGVASLWLTRNVIVKPESMPLDEYLRRIGGKA